MDILIEGTDSYIHRVIIDGIEASSHGTMGGTCCRQIFIWQDKYIIKFDSQDYDFSDDNYSRQSSNEIEMIELIEEADRKYFFYPVHWGFYNGLGYVVQEYGKREWKRPDNYLHYAERTLMPVIRKYNLTDIHFYDERNWLYTSEGAKIYDYGMQD